MAMLTVSGNPDYALKKHHLESLVDALCKAVQPPDGVGKLSIFVRIQQVGKGMPTNFYEMLLYGPDHISEILHIQLEPKEAPISLKFNISPIAFFQPNTMQAERLYSTALQMADIPKDAVVYDLYCGTGTLGICAAQRAKQVVGIEISPESALDARSNAALNGMKNVTIFSGAVRHVLGSLLQEHNIPAPDVVMVDPPRPGLDPDALKQLVILNPAKILYVSCNPDTQVENIAELIQHGYKITSIQPVDQFPQTYHIENVVVLVKNSN
jgi:23S rRNA (uracil1939-C5)-methyltransferase